MLTPCAVSQDSSPASPLSEQDQRLIYDQLIELKACREQVKAYEEHLTRDAAMDARANDICEEKITLERRRAELAEERAKFYEQAYKLLAKKRSFGCWLKKIFTLGMAKC